MKMFVQDAKFKRLTDHPWIKEWVNQYADVLREIDLSIKPKS